MERGDYDRFREVLETGEPLIVRYTNPPKEFGRDRRLDLKVLKVGDSLGMVATDITHLKERETDLRASQEVLEELNIALKVLLRQRDADKEELGAGVLANVRGLIRPHLERLRQSRLSQTQRTDLDLLEESLNNLISPFMNRLTHRYLDLTPSEIMVADLVRQGWTSKEIAGITSSSLRAVEFHRSNLRK
jgi:hypothetical protein